MSLEQLSPGKNIPHDINVVIEIPSHSDPIKFEVDKKSGMLMVDRFVATSMHYPCNYGFIPKTLAEDNDPADVLVIAPFSLIPGIIIRCRPIGILQMIDESGPDSKILAVPIDKLTPKYKHIQKPEDVGSDFLASIEHFFQHYKDLEPGKWVKIQGWEGTESAHKEVMASIERYNASLPL